ncbi:MAG: hypothetical protein ABIR63_03390 [Sphingomicrobium sp.]
MSDGPIWFEPKSHGLGSGMPIAWQGWVLLVGFIAVSIGVALYFDERWLVALAILSPLTILFFLIMMRTTRGGWKWRWGDNQ